MKKNKEFENILDECLERVLSGESVEGCLSWYPDYAEELRPLLETAAGARQAVDIEPRREFRDRAGYEFQKAVREIGPVRRGNFFAVLMKPAWATILLVVIVLAAGSGTVAAANNSLPGEPLYSVKTATESVRLAFAFSEESKADLYVKLTDRRVEEIVRMAEKGDAEQINNATDRLENHLLAMAGLDFIGGADVLESQLARLESAEETFGLASSRVPAATQPPTATGPGGENVTPPEEITPPSLAPIPGPADAGDIKTYDASAEEGEDSDLRTAVMNSAVMNSAALYDILDDVGEEVREALYRAIEIALVGYDNIISNID